MRKFQYMTIVGMIVSAACLWACGGGGGSGSSSSTPAAAVTQGVAVDPYIVGSSFFEDLNGNGVHDANEQLSSLTDEFGRFSFATALTDGAVIVMKAKGVHSGLPYAGTLKRIVQSAQNGVLVVSPLTTLLANNISPSALCQLLEDAGLLGIVEDDLFKNPLDLLEGLNASQIDEAKLRLLQAAMTLNSFLSIVGYDATFEDCDSEKNRALLKNLADMVKTVANAAFVESIIQKLEGKLAILGAGRLFPDITVIDACNAAATAIQSYVNKIKTYMQELPSLHPDEIFTLLPPVERIFDECSLEELTKALVTFYVEINREDPDIVDAIAKGALEDSHFCSVRVEVNSLDTQGCAIEVTIICDPDNDGGIPSPSPTPEPPAQVTTGWIRSFDPGTPKIMDFPKALRIDSAGAIYVTGISQQDAFDLDVLTLKYSSEGDLLWSKRYGSPNGGMDMPTAMAVDGSGNVYVTGTISSLGGFEDFLTIKYDSNGNQVWVRQFDGPAKLVDEASAIAVDASGNVYVTGLATTGGGFFTSTDYATVKYSSDGVQLWASYYDGPASGHDSPTALAVDGMGNAYVTGASQGSGSGLDFATVMYDAAGAQQWATRYDNSQDDLASAIAIGPTGTILVTGVSAGAGAPSDYATVSYDGATGNQLWVVRSDSAEHAQDEPVAIAADAAGNVYVTGTAGMEIWNANSGYFTVKFDSAGVQQWAVRYDGPGNGWDRANGIALDAAGNIFVTGQSKGTDTASDYATVSYNPAGEIRWVERYDGGNNADDGAVGVATDVAGNVFVTGSTGFGGDETQITTIKYLP